MNLRFMGSNGRRLLFCIAGSAIFQVTFSAMSDPRPKPDLSPINEAPASPDLEFRAECMSGIRKSVAKFHWVLGKEVFTYNKHWGIVLRIDFSDPQDVKARGGVNRLVCWRVREDAVKFEVVIAYHARIEPL